MLLPSSTARILIASQAPGTKVHISGMPFTDASGDRLRDWLGVSQRGILRPGEFRDRADGVLLSRARTPRAATCRRAANARRPGARALMALMPQIELVLTIGLYAQAWHMGDARRASLTETVMNWREVFAAPARPRVLPLPHPSWRNTGWLKRNPWFETDLLPFLKTEIRHRLSRRCEQINPAMMRLSENFFLVVGCDCCENRRIISSGALFMDRLDRKILRLLQEDATLAVADVAKKVGLSTTPCWRRIQKLEEEGVIKRRVAILDPGEDQRPRHGVRLDPHQFAQPRMAAPVLGGHPGFPGSGRVLPHERRRRLSAARRRA